MPKKQYGRGNIYNLVKGINDQQDNKVVDNAEQPLTAPSMPLATDKIADDTVLQQSAAEATSVNEPAVVVKAQSIDAVSTAKSVVEKGELTLPVAPATELSAFSILRNCFEF